MRYVTAMPMSTSVRTTPFTVTTSPAFADSFVVTTRSLVPSAGLPVPSFRWVQFLPTMLLANLTTLPRTATVRPFSFALSA